MTEYNTLIQIIMTLTIPYMILTYNRQPIGIVPLCTGVGYFMLQYSIEDLAPMIPNIAMVTIVTSLIVSTVLRLLKVGVGGGGR